MKKIFIFITCLLLVSFASAHQSGDEVVVRTVDFEGDTYTFACETPQGYQDQRTWSIRSDSIGITEHEVTTTNSILTYTFSGEDLYHIGCQARNSSGDTVRGDFHIDRRTSENVEKPDIFVNEASNHTLRATCLPPDNTVNFERHWWALHASTGNEEKLATKEETITYTVSEDGLWDFTCGIWDSDAGEWSQFGLPIEFLNGHDAYVPNFDGCVPWESCPWQNESDDGNTSKGNLPPLTPEFLEPVEGQDDVEPHHFNLHVFEMEDPDNDTWVGTEYEIYDIQTEELVWHTGIIPNLHPRNGDGTFIGNLDGMDHLLLDHQYKTRARHHADSEVNSTSNWSAFINFKTRAEFNQTQSNWTWTPMEGYKIELVAQDVNLPITLEPAPDLYDHLPFEKQPKLYFTQLYGQIGMLLNDGTYLIYEDDLLNYDSFGSLPGSGEMGVIGLYADKQTGDLFVSMNYWNETQDAWFGKVERFHTNSSGSGAVSREIIISHIPVSPAHQVQEITRGPDGKLYLGTGDADKPQTADDPSTLYGKILRMNEDGTPPGDNPLSDYVYAAGLRNPFGHDWNPSTGELFVTNNGEDSHDSIYKVHGGETFGWCQETCNTTIGSWHFWEDTVVPTAIAYYNGNGALTNEDNGKLFMVKAGPANVPGQVDNGKRIIRITSENGEYAHEEDFVTYTGDGYGTPLGLAFLEDGLYFSDMLGEDGFVGIGKTRGNIYRILPGTQTQDPAPQPDGELTANIAAARWYPQGNDMVWECRASNGIEPYTYDYYFGDGGQQLNTQRADVWHTYPGNGSYDAHCVVHDSAGTTAQSAITTLVLGDGGEEEEGDTDSPVCGNGITENGEQCDDGNTQNGDGCNNTCQIEDSNDACHSTVQQIPAECTGGSITQDTSNGACRTIICGGLQVLACDKPDSSQPEYFEMYKQSSTQGIEICLAQTCISNNGYAASPNYPICIEDELPDEEPFCGNNITETGEQCDDGNTQNGDGCNNTCQLEEENETGDVNVSIAPWYPQGRDYVFVCNAPYAADTYDWNFGDGQKIFGRTSNDVYHTYAANGTYVIACTAHGQETDTGTREVVVA